MQVVVGIVEYTQSVYPVQGSFINTFNANTFVQSAVVTAFTDGAVKPIAVITTSTPIPSYAGYESTKYGERICGLNYLKGTTTSIATAG